MRGRSQVTRRLAESPDNVRALFKSHNIRIRVIQRDQQ
jgi:hypothetical protein